ncbi:MAG: DNA polymerase/3'-5' exonuclease PolX [Bryobacter sp.]|jgi:DNA polymerase (family 10)|nr:DNA polymerase/3'-5' exonuclease PolX [Bryobacter sp. CoA8 C33]
MDNQHVAKLLAETADLMEIAGEDAFRIRSYRNAASTIEGHPESVLEIVGDASRKVTDIAGIGKGIAAILGEIRERGSFERRDEMMEKYPPTALEMLKIQGLGPKSIKLLIEQFRVTTIDDLERLSREQKLRNIPRMGVKLEEKILKSIALYRRSSGRFLIDFASGTAEEVMELFVGREGITRVSAAGSLRRGKETVGDVDILVAGPRAVEALDVFAGWGKVEEMLAKGENKASARVGVEGIQVDVRALPEESFGAALQYFTGSKEHNVSLRTRAVRMGYTLNEYALAREATGEIVAAATEEEIYRALGLDWIAPELRENSGEIEAAEHGRLPRLIELDDIRGDLHMHTRESDGRGTLEEMARTARELGYEYIVITDHSKALAMANGLDEKRAIAFAEMVRGIEVEEFGLKVYAGIECDILKDGRMDLDDEALEQLDFVVGSVHSHMNLDEGAMTERLLAALENPFVKVVGHPTGRVLLQRDAYGYAFEKIAARAAEKGVAMEINASPERLDLHAQLIRAAKAKGVRFTISTDAHHPRHFLNMKYGVKMARRGWLERGDVLNTLTKGDFERRVLKRKV